MALTQEEEDGIKIAQARKMLLFKNTEEYKLLDNSYQMLKRNAGLDRQKVMLTQSTREMCLYHTGIEDGVQRCMDVVNRIISLGEGIEEARRQTTQEEE